MRLLDRGEEGVHVHQQDHPRLLTMTSSMPGSGSSAARAGRSTARTCRRHDSPPRWPWHHREPSAHMCRRQAKKSLHDFMHVPMTRATSRDDNAMAMARRIHFWRLVSLSPRGCSENISSGGTPVLESTTWS